MKILISVLATSHFPWEQLIQCIKKTWGSIKVENVKIIYYYGSSTENKPTMIGDDLYLPYEETYENIGKKTVDMFEYCLENFEFDYICRPNASSYVVQNELVKYLENKPRENYASSIIGHCSHIERFLSGVGYILSKNVVKKIVDNKKSWNHNFIDDIAISLLLNDLHVPMVFSPRQDYINGKDEEIKLIKDIYVYRCKVEKDQSREENLKTFLTLHSQYLKLNL